MYFENMLLISNLLAGKYWLYSNRMKETLKMAKYTRNPKNKSMHRISSD